MEYIYAALLLNEAGKEVNKENMKKVLESAGVTPDDAQLNIVVSALEGVDIKDVISKNAGAVAVAAPSAGGQAQQSEEKKEEPQEEEKELSEEEAAAGLSALFG